MRLTKRNRQRERADRQREINGEGADMPNVFESLLRSRHLVGSEGDTDKEQAEVTDEEKEKEREQRIRMYLIESLFRSHHSAGYDCDTVGRDR
jgi:hypothetical protein